MITPTFTTEQSIKFDKLFLMVTTIAGDMLINDPEKEQKSRQEFLDDFFIDIKTQKDGVKKVLLFQKWIASTMTITVSASALTIIANIFLIDILPNTIQDTEAKTTKENLNEDNLINLSDRRK